MMPMTGWMLASLMRDLQNAGWRKQNRRAPLEGDAAAMCAPSRCPGGATADQWWTLAQSLRFTA